MRRSKPSRGLRCRMKESIAGRAAQTTSMMTGKGEGVEVNRDSVVGQEMFKIQLCRKKRLRFVTLGSKHSRLRLSAGYQRDVTEQSREEMCLAALASWGKLAPSPH